VALKSETEKPEYSKGKKRPIRVRACMFVVRIYVVSMLFSTRIYFVASISIVGSIRQLEKDEGR
jgi:hypothetical protein